MEGWGLRVGLGEAEFARGAEGILSCSILLERPPFTSLPTLFRPMEEKKRRRNSFGLPSSFLKEHIAIAFQFKLKTFYFALLFMCFKVHCFSSPKGGRVLQIIKNVSNSDTLWTVGQGFTLSNAACNMLKLGPVLMGDQRFGI